MKSKAYKIKTGIIAAIGGVSGIYCFFAMPNYNIVEGTSSPDFYLLLSVWISTFLVCSIFYGIASILEYLEDLGAYQDESIETKTHAISLKNAENIDKGDWICPKCGNVNKTYVGSCGCGYSKDNTDLWECPKCHVLTPYNDDKECMNCHWRP